MPAGACTGSFLLWTVLLLMQQLGLSVPLSVIPSLPVGCMCHSMLFRAAVNMSSFFERRKLQVDTFTASGGTLHTRWYYNESVNCHGTLKVHKCPPWCYNKTFSHFLYKQYHLRYWHTSSASFVSLTHTGFRLLTHTTSSHCGVLLWLDDKNTLWY